MFKPLLISFSVIVFSLAADFALAQDREWELLEGTMTVLEDKAPSEAVTNRITLPAELRNRARTRMETGMKKKGKTPMATTMGADSHTVGGQSSHMESNDGYDSYQEYMQDMHQEALEQHQDKMGSMMDDGGMHDGDSPHQDDGGMDDGGMGNDGSPPMDDGGMNGH